MARLPEKRGEATYRELGTVFGIMLTRRNCWMSCPPASSACHLSSSAGTGGVARHGRGILLDNLLTELEAEKADADDDDD